MKIWKKLAPSIMRGAHQLGREGLVVVAEEQRGEAEAIDDMDEDEARTSFRRCRGVPRMRADRDEHDLERDEAGRAASA